jgi:hypothetical protein
MSGGYGGMGGYQPPRMGGYGQQPQRMEIPATGGGYPPQFSGLDTPPQTGGGLPPRVEQPYNGGPPQTGGGFPPVQQPYNGGPPQTGGGFPPFRVEQPYGGGLPQTGGGFPPAPGGGFPPVPGTGGGTPPAYKPFVRNLSGLTSDNWY